MITDTEILDYLDNFLRIRPDYVGDRHPGVVYLSLTLQIGEQYLDQIPPQDRTLRRFVELMMLLERPRPAQLKDPAETFNSSPRKERIS